MGIPSIYNHFCSQKNQKGDNNISYPEQLHPEELSLAVKKANRQIYNKKNPEEYNKNPSIFNEKRRKYSEEIIKKLAHTSGNEFYLDVGTGTGNMLRIASKYFKNCFGTDISENLLLKIKNKFPECRLAAADAEYLPFRDNTFNCISCYALLHHLYKHDKLFKECNRILKPGGTLYTDHDPNYYLHRFYHVFYKIKYRNKPGFGSETEELAEYHHANSSGINPDELKKILQELGFEDIKILYRNTDKPMNSFPAKAAMLILRATTKVFPLKSLFTHFAIIARKGNISQSQST